MNKQSLKPVSYREFRLFLSSTYATKIKGKGFETAIYNNHGEIQAIIEAASIDSNGRCNPAKYYVRKMMKHPHYSMVA